MAAELLRPEQVRSLIAKLLDDASLETVGVTAPLTGVIDSFSLVEVIPGLEKEYKLEIPVSCLGTEQWASFETIASMLNGLRANLH